MWEYNKHAHMPYHLLLNGICSQQWYLDMKGEPPSHPHPHPASWLHIIVSHIGSQVKRRQSQSYKFKEFAKISNFWIWKQTVHATHLLKLLVKMCKYEMDPMCIVEDKERTQFCPQTDILQTDRRTRWNQYTPFQLRWSGGYNESWCNGI